MEAELQTRVNLPVVLVNREGLYVIVAVLGVSILGCAGVLTYSFTNYAKLKRNADEARAYIASRVNAAAQISGGKQAAADGVSVVTSAGDRTATVEAMVPPSRPAGSDRAVELSASVGASERSRVDATFAAVASRKVSVTEVETPDSRRLNEVTSSESKSTAAASTAGTDAEGVASQA
ncbi:hypothetical protein HPB49_012822 [Dermacentor silvarum]|uniref:Uncharacterized protein n=1 Tax=Dermacentor silvarum TaxID=543639 RepID=A0ACB8D5M3_DERSI|nr:hypothetical protein HPB49_012822 [Dermacentor silvarum]